VAITTGLLFELHALGTLLLFAIWPLTRLGAMPLTRG
jgi:hypothetical protein